MRGISWLEMAMAEGPALLGRLALLVTLLLALPLLSLQGCAMISPKPVVTGQLTAQPEPLDTQPKRIPSGAIYQVGMRGNVPLFEDRRPRSVGDILTIVIRERTNAAKNVSTASSRSGSAKLGLNVTPQLLPPKVGLQGLDMEGSNEAQGTGSSRADNTFTGTLTATVIEVLPNGNLRVAGDKQMAINRGSEHVRFSGVVDPRSISGANTVLSTQVADARIEFRSQGRMDEVQEMGWLQRFFLNVLPF